MYNYIRHEYPKAAAYLVIGIIVVALTGQIPESFLKPAIVEQAQFLLSGIFAIIFGRFIRFPKSKVPVPPADKNKKYTDPIAARDLNPEDFNNSK